MIILLSIKQKTLGLKTAVLINKLNIRNKNLNFINLNYYL